MDSGVSSNILIVEGLTGSGKTSTINALQSMASFALVREEETFNDFMTELQEDSDVAASRANARMSLILRRIETTRQNTLLERFHFSQIALGSDWSHYRDLNDRCRRLGCAVAVLHIPRRLLSSRSLYRTEYGGEDWQSLTQYHGTEESALRALEDTQNLRIEAVKQSGLPHRIIDTSEKAWPEHAAEIASWLGWPTLPTARNYSGGRRTFQANRAS
jgi:hypothetical protein